MERRDFMKAASLGAVGAMLESSGVGQTTEPEAKRSPNIIFVVSDQHRAGLTKRSGFALDTSPMLDRLADRGIGFEHAYCTTPLCVPSRTSMLTGRWPDAHRVRMNLAANDAVFEKDLYQVAKARGYKTGLAGKNHTYLKEGDVDFWRPYSHWEGFQPPGAPKEYREYDEWLGTLQANAALTPTPFPIEIQYPYRIVSDSIEFVDQCGDAPFILQVGFPEPHDPEQVPKPYWDMFPPDSLPKRCAGPEALQHLGFRARWLYGLENSSFQSEKYWRRYNSNYFGMLRLLDDQLARLHRHLEEKRLVEDTILIYLADHGDYLMDYGLARKGVGLFECLTRIPMVWSGGRITPSKIGATAFVSNADVLPTICEAIGAEIPHGVQGRSLWPLLLGQEYPKDEFRSIYSTVGLGGLYYQEKDNIPYSSASLVAGKREKMDSTYGVGWDELNKVTQSGLQKMVRMGDWKLIYDMMGYGQLYDLSSDPCELRNRFNDPGVAAKQQELMAELLMWTIRSQDSLPTGPQNAKYQTKWPKEHNWYSPYREEAANSPFIP
ncbi:MAG TPA: sulfatase-like hydrolase/transferase [Terracidiphilus sp.]|nr:sulfatase-like hydrolase/transferase [Terracidiphilus sp.]